MELKRNENCILGRKQWKQKFNMFLLQSHNFNICLLNIMHYTNNV